MNTSYAARPAEWLHSKPCLAKAVIAAVENARDADLFSDHEFALWLQDGGPRADAFEYLTGGMTECICPQPWPSDEEQATPIVHRFYLDHLDSYEVTYKMVNAAADLYIAEYDENLDKGKLMNALLKAYDLQYNEGDRVRRVLDNALGTVQWHDETRGGVGVLLDAGPDVLGAYTAWALVD